MTPPKLLHFKTLRISAEPTTNCGPHHSFCIICLSQGVSIHYLVDLQAYMGNNITVIWLFEDIITATVQTFLQLIAKCCVFSSWTFKWKVDVKQSTLTRISNWNSLPSSQWLSLSLSWSLIPILLVGLGYSILWGFSQKTMI